MGNIRADGVVRRASESQRLVVKREAPAAAAAVAMVGEFDREEMGSIGGEWKAMAPFLTGKCLRDYIKSPFG